MGLVYPSLPTVGEPNSTEQPKVRQSLIDLRDTINGYIDADNLASNAVTLAKMADNSVDTPELVDGAVTAAKIEDLAVTPAKLSTTLGTANLKVAAHVNAGSILGGASGDRTLVSVASVAPGWYHVIGHVSLVDGADTQNLRITSTGGTATVYGPSLSGTMPTSSCSAVVIVTATTTLNVTGDSAGSIAQATITAFGINT